MKKQHQSVRPVCCGKKRSLNQVYHYQSYDGAGYKCKDGRGCKKIKTKNKWKHLKQRGNENL